MPELRSRPKVLLDKLRSPVVRLKQRIVPNKQNKSLSSDNLYSRISNIWGIERSEIRSQVRFIFDPKERLGIYDNKTHTTTLNLGNRKYWRKLEDVIEHEQIHGINNILQRAPSPISKYQKLLLLFGYYPKKIQYSMEAEAIAELSDINRPKRTYGILEQEMNKDFFLKTILFTVAYLPSFISAKLLARRIELKLLRPALHRLFDKHGVDGLILYFVKPPKTIGALETILWERYMLKQGFLSPTGGLTDIGVAYLRGVLPKEEILKRAEEMKRRYEKLALPEQTKEEIFRKTEEMNI